MTSSDDINLGNPMNARHDAEERNDAKVTNADHPRRTGRDADDLFNNPPSRPDIRPATATATTTTIPTPVIQAAATHQRLSKEAPPMVPAPDAGSTPANPEPIATQTARAPVFDTHTETIMDPDIEMIGDSTSHRDPLSGNSGTHHVGVGVGAGVGGAAVGAASGLVAGAIAGPLGAALGLAAGTVLGAFAGGYAGKGIAESVNPTTEDHYWRHAFRTRKYVPKGAAYELYEPAYAHGIQMREFLIDMTWEEAEPVIHAKWEEFEYARTLPWEQARPAIQDAWDRLTPEPDDEDVDDAEKSIP